MKRLFLLSFLVIALSVTMSAQRTYVLVTGVSRYANEANNLSQTTKDASAFKAVMEKQTRNVSILTSKYANHDNILKKLRAICNRAQKNDRVIFYFSGHGYPGGIASYDNHIEYGEITRVLASSAAKEKIVFIDACYAGSVANKKGEKAKIRATGNYNIFRDAAKSGNMIFFTGCRADETSLEGPWVGAGFFTQSLVKGLRGKADTNGDRDVSVIELFNYIYKDVQHRAQSQHPQLIAPKSCHNSIITRW